VLVVTLGDLLLDVIVRVDAPIAADTDTYGRTHVGAGGQAANVAAWVVALGDRARFVGKRARDPAGRLVADALRSRGVELAGPEAETGTGTVVSLATPDGKRAMLSDRGVSVELGGVEAEWLEGCDRLHLPAYSLVVSPLRQAALAAARLAPRVSVDLSSTAAIAAAGIEELRATIAEIRPDLVFATEEEQALTGPLGVETLVLKRGARGCSVNGRDYAAEPAEVVDGTGAGDAFAAGFIVGGPELGLRAAARCVARMGAMP
jgi:sugar/nucleoside kinase (ribokinase family)